MDVHCSTCGEPWDVYHLWHDAIFETGLSHAEAEMAHADLVSLRVQLTPYAAVLPRAWELRANLTSYDACYVALAEALSAPLATLDRKLIRAPGPRCRFETP